MRYLLALLCVCMLSPSFAQSRLYHAANLPTDVLSQRQSFIRQRSNRPKSGAKTTSSLPRLASASRYSYWGAELTYVPKDTTTFTYSAGRGGDLTHTLKFDNSVFQVYLATSGPVHNRLRTLQNFDAGNNILSQTVQVWRNDSGGLWRDSLNTLNAYDGSGNTISTKKQVWDSVGYHWKNTYMDSMVYDGAGNVVFHFWGGWDTTTSMWIMIERDSSTYNSFGSVLLTFTDYTGSGGMTWINSYLDSFTYDASDSLLSHVSKAWDTSSSTYLSYVLFLYGYTSTIDSSSTEFWNGTAWYSYYREYRRFDASGLLVADSTQFYDSSSHTWQNNWYETYSDYVGNLPQSVIAEVWSGSEWVNPIDTLYTYNSHGQVTIQSELVYDAALHDWIIPDGGNEYLYYYDSSLSVKPVSNTGGDATIYPVPASDMLHVDLKWDEPQSFTLQLMDVTGTTLYQRNVQATTVFHGNVPVWTLPNGNYILIIKGGEGSIVKRLVVVH